MKNYVPSTVKTNPNAVGVVILTGLVVILLINDFILKQSFHNYATGKLSDIAGVAAVGVFCCLIVPRLAGPLLCGIAVGFAWWKSSYAGGFIDLMNQLLPFTIGRVIDRTDLIALATLPAVYFWSCRRSTIRWRPRKLWEFSVVGLSLFAFAATEATLPTSVSYNREYSFQVSADSLKSAVRRLSGPTHLAQESDVYFGLVIPWHCSFGLNASTRILPRANASTLYLDHLWSDCHRRGWSDAELLRLFEDSVIARLPTRSN